MKKILLATLLITLTTLVSQAKTISSESLSIKPSSIDKLVTLVDKNQPGSSQKKLNIVVTDGGMSTDVSPRYTIYLGYASMAEMGNITSDFKISDQAYKFVSAVRKSAGIYEVKTIEYRHEENNEGMYEVTHIIDATKMFADENAYRKNCGEDFCDGELKSTVTVTETAKKQE